MGRRFLALGVATAMAVATGCDSDEPNAETEVTAPVVQLGGPGETNRVLSEEELAATPTVPGHTDADVDFVHAMIAHHQQALDMTALVDERAADDDLPLLAERMEVSQLAEIEQLRGWLTTRGEDPEEHEHEGMAMPGMLTAEQLAQLAATTGEQFDVLFLQSMIHHHEGAVVMVETLLTGGFGGQEPQIFQIAQSIESDQQIEIARMKSMLVELAPAVSSEGG